MREQTKHTPGPWTFNPEASVRKIRAIVRGEKQCNHIEVTRSSTHPTPIMVEPWVQFASKEFDEMQDANFRLASAAPDLLEACKAYLDDTWDGRRPPAHSTIEKIRAAVVKAGTP